MRVFLRKRTAYIGMLRGYVKSIGNYSWGKRFDLVSPSICNCLEGAGDFYKQPGVAYEVIRKPG
jgi:hypothetical protein